MKFKQWDLLNSEEYKKQETYYKNKNIKYNNKYINSFRRYSDVNTHQDIFLNTKEGRRKGQNVKDCMIYIGDDTESVVYATYVEDIDKLYVGKHNLKTRGKLSKEDIDYFGSGIKIQEHEKQLKSDGINPEEVIHTYIIERCDTEQEAFEKEAHWINNMFDKEIDDYNCKEFLNLKTKYTKKYLEKTAKKYSETMKNLKEKYNKEFIEAYSKLNTYTNKQRALEILIDYMSREDRIETSIFKKSKVPVLTSKIISESLININTSELPDLMDTCFPSFIEKWYKSPSDVSILEEYSAFLPFLIIRESIVEDNAISKVRV